MDVKTPMHLRVMCCSSLAALSLLLVPAATAQPQPTPPLADILERIGQYVRQFEEDFSTVISDEQYDQRAVLETPPAARTTLTRRITSETSFMWVAEESTWLTVRNVLVVDPMLGLQISGRRLQPRFSFAMAGRERLDGVDTLRLIVDDPKFNANGTIAVAFTHDAKLDRWLPARMDETYVQQGLTIRPGGSGAFVERIEGVATYANYRRFETSGRLVTP